MARSKGWKKPKKKKTDPVVGLVFIAAFLMLGMTSLLGQDSAKMLKSAIIFVFVLGILFAAVLTYLVANRIRLTNKRRQAVDDRGIDGLSWQEFELFVIDSLEDQGYKLIHHSSKPGDQGTDIVMKLGKEKWSIQVKHSTSPISGSAAREAFGSMALYDCTRSMAVTNNHFTAGAKTLAFSNGTVLFDREDIGRWLLAATPKP